MAKFVIGQPITTTTPEVVVDAGLKTGAHRFQLVVVDSSGNTSKPAEVVVQVGPLPAPTITVVAQPVRLTPTRPTPPVRPVRPTR